MRGRPPLPGDCTGDPREVTRRRRGVSLPETLVALLLTFFLLGLLGRMAVRHHSSLERLVHRMEVLEARRIARDLVGLGVAGGGVVGSEGGDALRLRNFVGTAVACGEAGWAYRGRRVPEPDRDSLWVVGTGGQVAILPLLGLGSHDCPVESGTRSLRLRFGDMGWTPVLARVFETGRYRVTDAVRYGRIGSPLQPLTAAELDPSGSAVGYEDGVVELHVKGRRESARVLRRWRAR